MHIHIHSTVNACICKVNYKIMFSTLTSEPPIYLPILCKNSYRVVQAKSENLVILSSALKNQLASRSVPNLINNLRS